MQSLAPGTSQTFRLTVLGAGELTAADGNEARAVLAQPKRFALLTWLVLAPVGGRGTPRARFVRRDTAIALFWPEASEDSARNSLRQALHFLRQTLGPTAVARRGEDELGIDPDVLWCDAVAFQQLLDDGRPKDALSLYAGDLLPGFLPSDVSPEFQRWVDDTRRHLRARAADAAWQVAREAEASGSGEDAVHYARLASRLAPDDEVVFRRLLDLLDRLGDRAGALRAYDDFRRRLAEELEVEPGPEVQAAAASLRERPIRPLSKTPEAQSKPGTGRPNDSPAIILSAGVTSPGVTAGRRRLGRWMVAAGIVAVIGAAATVLRGRTADSRSVLAVGAIDVRGKFADTTADPTVRGLLSTDLARVSGLEVVGQARIFEILSQRGLTQENRGSLSDVARRAGATELIEGSLVHIARDSFRLDLERVDLGRGVIRGAVTVEGTTLLGVIRHATIEIAAQLSLPPPAGPAGPGSLGAVASQRLYEQGLRAFYRGSLDAAASLFDAALAEDSTLTMAAYYGSLVGVERGDRDRVFRLGAHALRMADRAPARDRLLVRVAWMNVTNDPRELVLAESLAVRYPNDPEAAFAWGRALTWSLDGSAAITQLRRVVTLEGPSVRDDRPLCRACDALWMIFGVYVNLDSLLAAERIAREWIRTQPTAGRPWASLSAVLEMAGRDSEAVAAAAEAVRRGTALNLTILRARLAMRRGHLAVADRFLADVASEPANALDALWWRVISLRNQWRLDDALTVARQYRRLADSASGRPMTLEATVPVAQTLFEMGQYRQAAALFDSIAAAETSVEGVAVGVFARRKVWLLTHSSVARAAAGDTTGVLRLAAEIEELGRESGFGRDRRLHHYVRALAARARGEPAEAVRELGAMGPAIAGYSRASLDLGRALTALGRSEEAVPVLRRPLHSALDASGYYVTFRELHEALADAFAASGQPDSAAAHRAWVKRALGA